nr:hypothetical protein OH837_09365 [Streptomyces canus]
MAALLGALVDPVQIHSLIEAAGMAAGILAQLKAEAAWTESAVLETSEYVEWSPEVADESEMSNLQWILEAAELLDSAPLAGACRQGERPGPLARRAPRQSGARRGGQPAHRPGKRGALRR